MPRGPRHLPPSTAFLTDEDDRAPWTEAGADPVVASCARYLARLDEATLAAVLHARPDACVEPAPRGFVRLAQRLCGEASLAAALAQYDRDEVRLSQAIAAAGGTATEAALVTLTNADTTLVRTTAARLRDRALAWSEGGEWHQPSSLSAHWLGPIAQARDAGRLARDARADDLRAAVFALGGRVDGLRKPELIEAYRTAVGDLARVRERVLALAAPGRQELAKHETNSWSAYTAHGSEGKNSLVRSGLALPAGYAVAVPREVLVAAWLSTRDLTLTGRPPIPPAARPEGEGADGQSEARQTLAVLTAMLDDAGGNPVPALKKGGVGVRERSKLAARLAADEHTVTLCLDLAHAAGLLARQDAGYRPTDHYPAWRDVGPAARLAAVVAAWYDLPHAPTHRQMADTPEVAPPLPAGSGGRALRQVLLRTVAPDRSLRAVVEALDWFHPLPSHAPPEHAAAVAAVLWEGGALGLLAGDGLTGLGAALLEAIAAGEGLEELSARAGKLLVDEPCSVYLQSDLTAIVSGTPDRELADLLVAAASTEARGGAAVWRFGSASVRHALDLGWSAEQILAVLDERSEHGIPQPLEYLVTDVARRHGHIRVRAAECVLTGEAALMAEVAATRSLRALGLKAIAPTVLVAAKPPEAVIALLRAAGLFPVDENDEGLVVLARSRGADGGDPVPARSRQLSSARLRTDPVKLARALRADPQGRAPAAADAERGGQEAATFDALAACSYHLDEDELELLAHAVDTATPVLISYRDRNRTHTVRVITPTSMYGSWLVAWCHLRNAEREFTIGNIESVAPA